MPNGKKLDPKVAEKVMLKAGLKPLEPYKSNNAKWKCLHIACGEIVFPLYSSVKRGQGGCYECGRRKSELNRRIPEKKAVAIMLKAGVKPLEPYTNALARWKCQCLTCGHIGYPSFNMVNYGQGGCRPCSYIKTGLASRITEKDAKIRLKKQKLKLIGKYKWVDKRTYFKIQCSICKQVSETNWDTLGKKGRNIGCQSCSRSKASFQQVSDDMHRNLLAEHNLEPIGKYTGNQDLTIVKCLICMKRKKIRRSFLMARKKKMQGCMTCSGAKIADPKKIERIMKKAKLIPLVPYSGGHKKWKCECAKCGETVYPEFNSVLSGQGGCIFCAEIGFNYKKPAIVYVISHHQMNAIKIGITNIDSKPDRLKQFQQYGWEIHKRYDFQKGINAFKVEKDVFNWIRKDLNLTQHLTVEQMPRTRGETETVSADSITVLEIRKKIEELIKGYRVNP
jgi:hypothetical protein